MKIVVSNICSAFDAETIGSKVVRSKRFLKYLERAIERHDSSGDRVPGQMFVSVPEGVGTVSCGIGKRQQDPKCYVIRKHREGPKMFLRREFALPVGTLNVVVYTAEAYLADPDITSEEAKRVSGAEYVVVAVLANPHGPPSPVSPFRFVHNLAGGNKEYELRAHELHELSKWADFVIAKAKDVLEFANCYHTVAD